jgi:hypothetical protein
MKAFGADAFLVAISVQGRVSFPSSSGDNGIQALWRVRGKRRSLPILKFKPLMMGAKEAR